MSIQRTSHTNHYPGHQFQNERPDELTMVSIPEKLTVTRPHRLVEILNVPVEVFFRENPPTLNQDLIDQATENYMRMPRQQRGRFLFEQIFTYSFLFSKAVAELISKQSNTEATQLGPQEESPTRIEQVIATTTTNQILDNTAENQSSNLAVQALTQTEEMNNLLIAELNDTLQTFKTTLTDVQKNLDAALKKNQLLEKEIIQLNATIRENGRLHTAEMRENTQTISTLVQSVNTLMSDLRSTNSIVNGQKTNFELLAKNYNEHNHSTNLNSCGTGHWYLQASTGPSTPYMDPNELLLKKHREQNPGTTKGEGCCVQ